MKGRLIQGLIDLGRRKGVSVPGAFKLNHLQHTKPILFQKIFNFFTFMLGGQFLLPHRDINGKVLLFVASLLRESLRASGRKSYRFVRSFHFSISLRSFFPGLRDVAPGAGGLPQDCSSSCAVTVSRARKDNRERERDREGEREREREAGRANDRKERARERARDKDAG